MDRALILFDLGGVLADLGSPPRSMQLDLTSEQFWSAWLSSETVRGFETGRIEESEFLARFAGELGLAESRDRFRARLLQWQLRIFPDVAAALSAYREEFDIALCSNTNPIHWDMVREQDSFERLFDHVFLSFEIGCAKPDPAVFEHVLGQVAQEPSRVLFLDDSRSNVDAAQAAGMKALHVDGRDGIASVLRAAGIARPEDQAGR